MGAGSFTLRQPRVGVAGVAGAGDCSVAADDSLRQPRVGAAEPEAPLPPGSAGTVAEAFAPRGPSGSLIAGLRRDV